jgi:hypothetical protein
VIEETKSFAEFDADKSKSE